MSNERAPKRLVLEPKLEWSKGYTNPPATGRQGESALHDALARNDIAASRLHSPRHSKKDDAPKESYDLPETADAFHIRGERFHRLDGLWRYKDGHYLLFEAKGEIRPKEAKHVAEKLNHWMVLAHGKDDVVRAWMLDWLFIQRDVWAASQRDRRDVERELDEAIETSIGEPWDKLTSRPPEVVVLCSKITKDAAMILRAFYDEWESGLAGARLWIARRVTETDVYADVINFGVLPRCG